MSLRTDQQLSRADIEALPNFHRKSGKNEEYGAAVCPFCGAGKDRFCFWPNVGNYWCRKCHAEGFVTDAPNSLSIDPARYEEWRQAEEERRLAEKQRKWQEQHDALALVATMLHRVEFYHSCVDKARDYWHGQGLSDETIARYKLGYTSQCPTWRSSASYVIPYFCQGQLTSIRHRLVNPGDDGKYRPEFSGLPAQMFNLDSLAVVSEIDFGYLDRGQALLVEGEVKSMFLDQSGFTVVGIPGVETWKRRRDEWLPYLEDLDLVYVCLDPGDGMESKAWAMGYDIVKSGVAARVVLLEHKPDDFFVIEHGTVNEFMARLEQAETVPVNEKTYWTMKYANRWRRLR